MTPLNREKFAKTKILCTLGPATNSVEMIQQMMEAGMDGIRLNFSHGDFKFYESVYENIHSVSVAEKLPLAVLIDLQGPKMRIGELASEEIEIRSGDRLEITSEKIIGNAKKFSASYERLPEDSAKGDLILIDDGLIRLRVIEKTNKSVLCEIENGGILKPKKGMNLPGMKLSTPSVTEKDFHDLEFAISHRLDYVALSFVREREDIIKLREWLNSKGMNKQIIAKIEKKEAVENFEEILNASDGIMIARGDLGVELQPHDVPVIQKNIIKRCNETGKLVITATQMLESMISNPIPTRAEASDVANAVWDGTDAVMLSGETSIGKFPLGAVRMMNDIIMNTERHPIQANPLDYEIPADINENLFDSVGKAVCAISRQISAFAIVVFTLQGRTAANISKYRPDAEIIAVSNSFDTMNRLCLKRGITSVYCSEIDKEHIGIDKAKKIMFQQGLLKEGDIVIFTAGAPYSEKSRTNWLRIETI